MLTPDTKDWTWVITRACPDCGYDAATVDPSAIGSRVRATLPRWQAVAGRPDASRRPSPDVWSPLEYACHVRDVLRIFDGRLELVLTEHGPRFANWDQDATAVESRYAEQDPAVLGPELAEAAERIADRFDSVRGQQWGRTAERSDGARFTTTSFGRYFLHDIEHHLYDVNG
jgi:hypothetical protein